MFKQKHHKRSHVVYYLHHIGPVINSCNDLIKVSFKQQVHFFNRQRLHIRLILIVWLLSVLIYAPYSYFFNNDVVGKITRYKVYLYAGDLKKTCN